MKPQDLNRSEQAITDAIQFALTLSNSAPERAILARHICVLCSGYLENIVRTTLSTYTTHSRPRAEVMEYVEWSVDRFQNPDFDKILELTGRFKGSWVKSLSASIDQQTLDAITSIVSNRHLIAHGRHSGVSLSLVQGWFAELMKFRRLFEKTCV